MRPRPQSSKDNDTMEDDTLMGSHTLINRSSSSKYPTSCDSKKKKIYDHFIRLIFPFFGFYQSMSLLWSIFLKISKFNKMRLILLQRRKNWNIMMKYHKTLRNVNFRTFRKNNDSNLYQRLENLFSKELCQMAGKSDPKMVLN